MYENANFEFLVFSGRRTTARSYLRGPAHKTKSNVANVQSIQLVAISDDAAENQYSRG